MFKSVHMYQSFDEAFHVLMNHKDLEQARGGQIIKHADGFTVRLFNQPEDEEGKIIFEVNPSIKPSEDWKWMATTEEARQAYRAFISDPRNGELI